MELDGELPDACEQLRMPRGEVLEDAPLATLTVDLEQFYPSAARVVLNRVVEIDESAWLLP